MVIDLVVLVALVVACWLAATTLRVAIERRDPSVDHDLPSVLLRLACRRLPADRNEWGRALGAELAAIDSRSDRWSFVLGGVRTMIGGRLAGRLDRPSLAAFLGAVAVCAGLVVASIAAYPSLIMNARTPTFLIVVALVLGCYAVPAVAEARAAAQNRQSSAPGRRWAVLTGLAVGLVWALFASGWLNLHGWPLIAVAALPTATGALSARRPGGLRVGIEVVRPMAVVAGLSAFILSTLQALVTANGPYDTGQLDEAAGHGHASVATYWMGEGLAASLLLLLVVPLCTVLCGTIGAIIGQIRRPAHSR
ncbi:hypothetical protein [Microlunatus ginsengisoli]|uniref:Uncharacterized protein n=1 Tax=Microlunatus ginsengisoli TaxID=363863 RepID=A0ABP7AM73_9ACTN